MPLNLRSADTIKESMKAFLQQIQTSITDFNAGSIISTILNTIAQAIANLYTQLEIVYNAAFVSTATGADLDARVADFLITRQPATYATVPETFFMNTYSPGDKTVPAGTIISSAPSALTTLLQYSVTQDVIFNPDITDEQHIFQSTIAVPSSLRYPLGARRAATLVSVTGTMGGNPHTFVINTDCTLDNSDLSQAYLVWLNPPQNFPDLGTIFKVSYQALSVDVSAQATTVGVAGRVAPGVLNTLQTIPTGFDGATNYVNSSGGLDEQSDDSLREEVGLFISTLARATAPALEARARSVPGVASAVVSEPNPPQGYISVIIDDGTGAASDDLIRQVDASLSGTNSQTAYKAAGIIVSVVAPRRKSINYDIYALLTSGTTFDIATAQVAQQLEVYFSTLSVGETVLRAQSIKSIMSAEGVTDIDLDKLTIETNDATPIGGLTGDVPIPKDYTAILGTVTMHPM